MFIQQYPTRGRDDRNSSRPPRSQGNDTAGQRLTHDRSTSSMEPRDQYTKRSSIFSKRPKSTLTTASHDSSTRSHASSSSGSEISWRSSGGDVSAAPAEPETSKGRFLFGRGLRSKASASKSLRASSLLDLDSVSESYKGNPERGRRTPGTGVRISAPFDFQHLGKIEGEPGVISEDNAEILQNFGALPVGHRKAVIAPLPEEEDFVPAATQGHKRAPPIRPQRPDDLWNEHPGPAALFHAFQQSSQDQTDDAIDQPVSTEVPGHRTSPLNRRSPPRSSTRFTPTYSNRLESIADSEVGMHSLESLHEHEPFVPLYDIEPPGWIESSLPLLNTSTSIEPFPEHLRAPVFCPPLEQVPEEPEGTFSGRSSKEISRRPSLRHSKSSPAVATRYRSTVEPFPIDELPPSPLPKILRRPLSQCSQGSDTLGDPLHSLWYEAKDPIKTEPAPFNKQIPDSEPTWEDDIEYCYEHNAEADCDFNWQDVTHFDDHDSDDEHSWTGEHSSYNPSLRPSRDDSQSMISSASNELFTMSEKAQRIPSNSSVPELDYRYSHSTSSASLSIATPRDGSLYRGSDVLPPLPVDMYTSKDFAHMQYPDNDPHSSHDHAYNEILIARNTSGLVPPVPHYSEDRPQTILFTGSGAGENHHSNLPTPPLSGRQPVFTSGSSFASKTGVDDANYTLFDEDAFRFPLPDSRAPSTQSKDEEDAPQLVSRGVVGVQNAAKLRLFDAQSKLANLPPTSMPRSVSSESLGTGIQHIKLPTPPKTPLQAEMAQSESFFATPSPSLAPIPSLNSGNSRHPSPLNIAAPPTYLPARETISPAPQQANVHRQRAESAAARMGISPSSSSLYLDKSRSSALSAPEAIGRTGYTLFPSSQSASPMDVRIPPLPPIPVTKSEPSTTRPPSLAPSQSSRTSSRPESSAASTKSKSKTKSKSASRAKAYQERYPLGI